MKKIVKFAFIALVALSVANCSKDGADGINGKDGINGTNGVDGQNGKTILSGNGNPASSLGSIGDFYLNLENHTLFGPKTNSGWGSGVSLIGATGQNGKDGANGTNGTNGQNGADGKDGKTILSGNGTPNASLGNVGDIYFDLQNKILFGPKTDSGWGSGISLGGSSTALKGDYLLSKDGRTLLQWFDKDIPTLDMEADPELKKVTRIGSNAFADIEAQTIILPQGLKKIGNYAFGDSDLQSLIIPSSVTEIGTNIFGKSQIKEIKIEVTTPPVLAGNLGYLLNNPKIKVPISSLHLYQANTQWKEATDITQYNPSTGQYEVICSRLEGY